MIDKKKSILFFNIKRPKYSGQKNYNTHFNCLTIKY